YNSTTSAAQTVTISKTAQASLSVSSPTTGTFGQTLQITSSGGNGTGAVSFLVGSSTACALNSGDATKLDITRRTRSRSITPSTTLFRSYNSTTSAAQTVTISKAAQASLSVSSPTSGTFGQTLQIMTSGGSGTGAVSYSVGSSTACALNSGDATKLDITSGSGSCSITAS